jgi:hypothetical protein
MIFGDDPTVLNEYESDTIEALGTNIFNYGTANKYRPDIEAIKQSSNLYAYCMNNPNSFIDPSGNNAGELAIPLKDLGLTLSPALVSAAVTVAPLATGLSLVGGAVVVNIDFALKVLDNPSAYSLTVSDKALYGKSRGMISAINTGGTIVLAKNTYGDKTVGEVLKSKKGSIKNAPLPPGGPNWKDLMPIPMETVRKLAQKGETGYKEIWKLLTDGRFNIGKR